MNAPDLFGVPLWWALLFPLVIGIIFGLMPGLILQQIVRLYPKGHPRREELLAELYAPEMGHFGRFVWVFQQLELASRQGLTLRIQARRQRRAERDQHEAKGSEPADESDAAAGTAVIGEIRVVLPALTAGARSESDLDDSLRPGESYADYLVRTGKRQLFPGNSAFRLDAHRVTSEHSGYTSDRPGYTTEHPGYSTENPR